MSRSGSGVHPDCITSDRIVESGAEVASHHRQQRGVMDGGGGGGSGDERETGVTYVTVVNIFSRHNFCRVVTLLTAINTSHSYLSPGLARFCTGNYELLRLKGKERKHGT